MVLPAVTNKQPKSTITPQKNKSTTAKQVAAKEACCNHTNTADDCDYKPQIATCVQSRIPQNVFVESKHADNQTENHYEKRKQTESVFDHCRCKRAENRVGSG